MMDIVEFVPEHLQSLIVNEYVGFIQDSLSTVYGEAIAAGAHTGIVNGRVIGCAGIYRLSQTRWHAWALLSEESAKHMLPITRAAKSMLENYRKPRIETAVRCDFKQGNKFVKLLGFNNETPKGMKNYGEDGMDYYLYARCA